ncbi:MAG TPA: DUF58 domain-containing protein [Propionibacteriaceae bacterium]|nr:DUF58 domain-containing protein [Propionibacteriaceae bacterium]
MTASPGTDRPPGLTPQRMLRRLEWRVVRRLDGLLQGDHRTTSRGQGLDVADLREYTPGDDLRFIDWNVTARMDTPYVREYLEDRELTCWLLLDHSASMGFGPVDRTKARVLTELATTMAYVLARGGNRVGALVYGDRLEKTVPPGAGRLQVLRIAQTLLDPPRSETHTTTDLATLLRHADGIIRRRSLVLVVSDFQSKPGWEDHLGRLARRHDVVCIEISDPREHDLPDVGLVYVEDAETGEQIFVDTNDPGFRARLAAAVEGRRSSLAAAVAHAGAELHHVGTDDDMVLALTRIAALRSRRASGRLFARAVR